MAVKHKSVLKRARQNKKRRLRNKSYLSNMRNLIKKIIKAVNEKKKDEAKELLKAAISIISITASKGIIHKKNASRKISRLTKKVNSI